MNHEPAELHFSGKPGNEMLKYKIQECLERLTVYEYRIVVRSMPDYLGKSINTFWNYAKIPIDSKMDIPYCTVRMLEVFFGLRVGDLLNASFNCSHYSEIINESYRKSKEYWVQSNVLSEDDQ